MRRVRVLEDRLGSEHPLVARNLSNLGVLFYRLNRCKKAEPLIRRARAILEKTYGTENALAASALAKAGHRLQRVRRLHPSGAHVSAGTRDS